tara:strand:+ start:31 stop:798 length:768 start_codon:yes stop_codon:yes gene_type:complete
VVKPRRISDFKPTFTNLAQTSHYQLIFGGLPTGLRQHLNVRDVNYRFITETSGLLCSNAVLPGSALATADIVGNYAGVTERMAHTKIFNKINLEFYVDSEYKSLKFLEHWIEFIANGSGEDQSRKDYFFRMEYPDDYKTYQTKLIKFDRDYKQEMQYNFYGMFPQALNSIPVRYEGSEVLKATAIFVFDRYSAGKYSSYDRYRGNYNNRLAEKKDKSKSGINFDTTYIDAASELDINYFPPQSALESEVGNLPPG